MNQSQTPVVAGDRASIRRWFTVESANRSLVFVRRIVRDIADNFEELTKQRMRRAALSAGGPGGAELEQIGERIAQLVEHLHQLSDELAAVGCELKDWQNGVVDFPAMIDGRRVCLCWRANEAEIAYWHEEDAGFAGRQPIDETFRRKVREQAVA